MGKKLIDTLKAHHDIIVYLILGAATTAVNFVVYYPLLNLVGLSAAVSNVIAWVISVLFAFVSNKPLAFKSKDWSFRVTAPEFVKFVGCRIGSGFLETTILMITVDLLHWNGNFMKLFVSVIVVISNYIASKYFVFHK